MSGRTKMTAIGIIIIIFLLIIGYGLTESRMPKSAIIQPTYKADVILIEGLGEERRAIDVTEIIDAGKFAALGDFIIDNGKIELISNLFGEVPIFKYPLNKNENINFSFYEGHRVGRQYDIIHILNFEDTLDCHEYSLQYYPSGFDSKDVIFDNSFGDPNNRWSKGGDIRDYIDGHVYLVGHYHEISDEDLIKQLAYYNSLLISKP